MLVGSLWWEGHVGGVTLPPHEAIEWVGWKQPYQWGLVLFTALVSEALSTALQGKGQAIVPASQGARPPSPPLAWAKVGEVADSGVATEEAYAAGEQ